MNQRIRFSDACELFILDAVAQGFTPHTVRFYRGRFKLIVRWLEEHGVTHLDELTPKLIKEYLIDMQERGLSSAYIHSHARAIRAFCNYCVRDDLIAVSPFERVRMPRLEKKVKPALTKAEVRRVLAACSSERDKALVLFLLDTGMRASECIAVNVGDVDGTTVTVQMGKGQKGRLTFIGARTRKQLLRYHTLERKERPEATEPLFTTSRGNKRLVYAGLRQIMRRLSAESGVAHLNAHALRRTMAINSLRSGMNIYVLARIMGHTDITVLRHYLDLMEDDMRDAAKAHGVVDNLL